MVLVCFLHGLDLTIVAPTVPSITNEFKTVSDIGWYSAVYGMVLSATNFFFGKMYTLFDLKWVYIACVTIFELGSILCTFAPTSNVFILGRAVAGMSLSLSNDGTWPQNRLLLTRASLGLGASGQGTGVMTFISRSFPVHKRPRMNGIIGFAQTFGLVSAPPIGGALVDAFSWRVCYGINVPLGVIAIAIFSLLDERPVPQCRPQASSP